MKFHGQSEYPEDFPANCPEGFGKPPERVCGYRILDEGESLESFRSYYELGKLSPKGTDKQKCNQLGLSLWKELEKVRLILSNPPRKGKSIPVAKLELSDNMGLVKVEKRNDNSTHINWWYPDDLDIMNCYILVDNINNE